MRAVAEAPTHAVCTSAGQAASANLHLGKQSGRVLGQRGRVLGRRAVGRAAARICGNAADEGILGKGGRLDSAGGCLGGGRLGGRRRAFVAMQVVMAFWARQLCVETACARQLVWETACTCGAGPLVHANQVLLHACVGGRGGVCGWG